VNEQKTLLNQVVPQLELLRAEPTQEAEILQGIPGIKTFTEMILNRMNKGEEFLILGAPRESITTLGGYFRDWHVRRSKKGIRCRILYNQEMETVAQDRGTIPLTSVRFLPDNIRTPALVDIAQDYVATIVFSDRPLCFIIKNRAVAESYRQYYELLWAQAK
jgi:hypothetical protein